MEEEFTTEELNPKESTAEKAVKAGEKAVETGRRVGSTARRVGRGAKAAWALVPKDPISLTVTAVIIILILATLQVVSYFQVIGGVDSCSTTVNKMGSYTYSTDPEERTKQLGNYLMTTDFEFLGGRPMTSQEAAGFASNFAQESGSNTLALEGVFTDSEKEQYKSNAAARAWSAGRSGNGLGLAQWTGGRNTKLLDLADSMGKEWWQPEVQFAMLKNELDGSYGAELLKYGFGREATAAENSKAVEEGFEKPAADHPERQASAADWQKKLEESGGVSKSTVSCDGQKPLAGGPIVDFILQTASKSPTVPACRNTGNKVLMDAAQLAYDNTLTATGKSTLNGIDTLCDCGKYVSVVLRASGFDPNFPDVFTGAQRPYMKENTDKYQKYDSWEEKQPGDIWVTADSVPDSFGHILFYVGDVDGKDMTAEASLNTHDAQLSENYYQPGSGDSCAVDNLGRSYYCFHPVGGAK